VKSKGKGAGREEERGNRKEERVRGKTNVQHRTSNVQRRISVRLRRFNFIKKTERSDTHIRRSMLSVRCWMFIFLIFGISITQ